MESVLRGAVAVAAVGGGGVNHDIHLPEAAQLLQLIVHLLNNIGISYIIQATWEVGRQELWDGLWQCGLNQLGSINRGPHYSQLGSPVLSRAVLSVLCYQDKLCSPVPGDQLGT